MNWNFKSSNRFARLKTRTMFTCTRQIAMRPARSQGRSRCIWLLVLVYGVSQGPIPVFHYHGDVDSNALHGSSMANHLRTCLHPSCHDEPLGWHCHFLMPGMTTEVPLGEDDAGKPDHATPLLVAKVHADQLHATDWNPIEAVPHVLHAETESSPTMAVEHQLRCRHFFDGFADQLSLPERFSIARC